MKIHEMLADLAKVYTLEEVAYMCGFASRGHLHDVLHQRQKTVKFELGCMIVDAHKALMKAQLKKKR